MIHKDTPSADVNDIHEDRDLYANLYQGTENTFLPLKVSVQFPGEKLHMAPHSGARFSPMTGVWLSRCREERITGPHSCSAEASLREGPQQTAATALTKAVSEATSIIPFLFSAGSTRLFHMRISLGVTDPQHREYMPPRPPASHAPDLRGRTRSRLTNTQDENRPIPSRQQREAVVPLGEPLGCHSMRTGAPQSCTPGSRAGWMPEPQTCFGVKEWEGASNTTALPGLLWLMGR